MLDSDIIEKFPLHYMVWKNDFNKLKEILQSDTSRIESHDPRGRTPLMLAIILGHIESVKVLLGYNASTFCVNEQHWTATQEAISTGDPELVKLLIVHRDEQRIREQVLMMTKMLLKLKESPDFYVQLKWEFFSWLPLVSRMCPSDICRVWKSESNVRIDTSFVGFSGSSEWVRGSLSYIFRLSDDGAVLDEVNHQTGCVYRHKVDILPPDPSSCFDSSMSRRDVGFMMNHPNDDFIAQKLTQPIFVTYVDTENIAFERSKSGVWGWRSNKKESINGHECRVFSASNVQIVTLKRSEHLSNNVSYQRNRGEGSRNGSSSNDFHDDDNDNGTITKSLTSSSSSNPLATLLLQAEQKCNNVKMDVSESVYNAANQVTCEEYFNADLFLQDRNIGRPRTLTTKVKTFKAHISICDDYPLSLQNQVLPIIDLMAEFNPHFHKLKDFVNMQLPAGFPMKIEIPLYHILTARITFENLFAANEPVECVTVLEDVNSENGPQNPNRQNIHCVVDDSIFQLPSSYRIIMENSPGHSGGLDEEDQMIQMAVQASLAEYGGISSELTREKCSLGKKHVGEGAIISENFGDDDPELQRAIAASLCETSSKLENANLRTGESNEDEELARVLELSKIEM